MKDWVCKISLISCTNNSYIKNAIIIMVKHNINDNNNHIYHSLPVGDICLKHMKFNYYLL